MHSKRLLLTLDALCTTATVVSGHVCTAHAQLVMATTSARAILNIKANACAGQAARALASEANRRVEAFALNLVHNLTDFLLHMGYKRDQADQMVGGTCSCNDISIRDDCHSPYMTTLYWCETEKRK